MEFPYRVTQTPQGNINVYYDGDLLCVLPPEFPKEHLRTLCALHLEGVAMGERSMLAQQQEIRRAVHETANAA